MSTQYMGGEAQTPGIVEWFRPGEYKRAQAVMAALTRLGVKRLRTALPWSDWQSDANQQWFAWLIPELAKHFELLPCFTFSPPANGSSGENTLRCEAQDFAVFVQNMLRDYGDYFAWLELGNPLDDEDAWDWEQDSSWQRLEETLACAQVAREYGKRVVLSGLRPNNPDWIARLLASDAAKRCDAIGLSGFPGTWDYEWKHWSSAINRVRQLMHKEGVFAQLWITASGYSSWRHDDVVQARQLLEACRAPVARVYWYSAFDLPRQAKQGKQLACKALGSDERCYHFGLHTAEGEAKFASRLWQERGLQGLASLVNALFGPEPHPGEALVRSFAPPPRYTQAQIGLSVMAPASGSKPVLITGGAGFVGSNLARRLLDEGKQVVIFDSLHRPGVERNLESLLKDYGKQVDVALSDVRDFPRLRDLVRNASQVYHFAAQVAVTTSLETPREDFEVNLTGTLNVLEALRQTNNPPPLLFTSTNKVYGALDDVELQRANGRYEPKAEFFARGISEQQALDFHSPYGCSKGAADQYVLDYARSYNLPAAVFRMSCVYGPHQFGTEDQGWVAHFLIQALKGKPITLYGDGCQVRDLLFVEDLVDAMQLAQKKMPQLAGRAFNMGGGPGNSTSLLEVIGRIEQLTGRDCDYSFADWRLGDQRYYVSDTRLFEQVTGWRARTDIDSGLRRLHDWLIANTDIPQLSHQSMPTGEGALQHGKFN